MQIEIPMKEEWKDIEGYEGLYQVSSFGNIKKIAYTAKTKKGIRYHKAKYIKQQLAKNGYYIVGLYKERKCKQYYVHRLVAKAFLENEKEMVNHIDGNKKNNMLSNLEWCTRQENEIHAWKIGLKEKIRETSKENLKIARLYLNNKIPVLQYTLDGDFIRKWESASDNKMLQK